MPLFESLKSLFWQLPLLSDAEKQEIFYYIKGKIKGEAKGIHSDDVLGQYVQNLLATQDLSNSFSIDYPRKPLIKLQDDDPKLIAYYLPQYYPDAHNEKWRGRGSTEWTNITKSYPQYVGQYQPRLPGELGFYDLRIMDNIYRQIELARFYGIYGFSFYFYWFDGERLLDLPFNEFINDKTIHFPFNICWVNETWTKQWEGSSNVPLMIQNKSIDSYKKFIKSCVEIFTHDNYIRINGKPVLTVYRPLDVPHPQEVLEYWRRYVYKNTGLELYIIGDIRSDKAEDYSADYKALGFDAAAEFAPGPQMRLMNVITERKQFVCDKFLGKVYDYKDFVENKRYFQLKKKGLYRALSPLWDNTARKKNRGLILDGSTPDLYKQWLIDIIRETKMNDTIDDRIIFINAWNEWAEGAYLEPDLKWKYGYLEATRDAILEARSADEKIGGKLVIDKKGWNCNSGL